MASYFNKTIGVNSKITLKTNGKTIIVYIVQPSAVNPLEYKISLNSPLAQKILTCCNDGSFVMNTPRGDIKYEIVEVA